MNLEQMRAKKKELGYTYEQIAERSGVPLGTVQKVFGGVTSSPRYDTLRALERVFEEKERLYLEGSSDLWSEEIGRVYGRRLSCVTG